MRDASKVYIQHQSVKPSEERNDDHYDQQRIVVFVRCHYSRSNRFYTVVDKMPPTGQSVQCSKVML